MQARLGVPRLARGNWPMLSEVCTTANAQLVQEFDGQVEAKAHLNTISLPTNRIY